jgi:hypothetical protein
VGLLARVGAVLVRDDGTGELVLAPPHAGAVPDRLRFERAPEEVMGLEGRTVDLAPLSVALAGAVTTYRVALAGLTVARVTDAGRLTFGPRDVFLAALEAARGEDAGALGDFPVAADDNRPGGPEPFDVYRHAEARRGYHVVVSRSVMEGSLQQLVTVRACKNGTYWSYGLNAFVGTFTRVEE